MTFHHPVRARYVDCDMQGIVYNAHYLTFVDDAFDCWLRELAPAFEAELGWEVMVKRAEIVWEGPARFGEVIDVACSVSRWGTTSLDASFSGAVGERPVFAATLTYVVVDHDDYTPRRIPDELRAHLAP